MAGSRDRTYLAGDVLLASQLNSLQDYFLNNALLVISPLTGSIDAGGFDITALDELAFNNAAANASATRRLRANAANLTWHDGTVAGRLFYAGGTDVPVADGGTALSSGTSGGILGYTATGTLASSILLTANALVLGGGAGATPTVLGSLGTTTTVLHGNAAGAPSFGAVALGTDVSGTLLAAQFPALTGDITTVAGALATTLKNTGPGATGPIGSATVAPIITTDAQGRVTALTSATITIGGLNSVQVFTANGTWTRPTGITKVIIEVAGGGGGGGGSPATASREGGGGGGGGYARRFLDVGAIASSTITIGGAGAGGAAGANAGAAGGTSSWADGTNTVSATGGAGGPAADAVGDGGAGGAGSGGTINVAGQQGGASSTASGSRGSPAGGGNSGGGWGAGAPAAKVDGAGLAGALYGGGGSGAVNDAATARAGGAGAAGLIVVWEYR